MVREKDLPAMLGVSRATIRRAMARGAFPKCIHVGRCVLWRRADLLAWIEGGCGTVE
jgi:predicted DNA-binding transcriptional regulator AlpA